MSESPPSGSGDKPDPHHNHVLEAHDARAKGHLKGHSHGHAHAPHHDYRHQNRSSLWAVLVLTLIFMAVEVATGFYTGSLALLADAGHMFSDAAGLGLALLAIWFARRPASLTKSYGYYRTEILASMANAVMLIVISLFVSYNACLRLIHPPHVLSEPMIWVAILGLMTNFIAVKILHSSANHSLNMRGAYLEVLNDAIGSAGVLVAAVIIAFTKWYWVDALVSGLIGLMIIPRTWLLLRESINILMEGTPARIDLNLVQDALKQVPCVIDVHDLHVWTITSGLDTLSAHVQLDNTVSSTVVLEKIHQLIADDFGIHHSTVQTELIDCNKECQCQGERRKN